MMKYIIAAIAISTIISCGRNEPLANYNPKSQQAQALKNVLLEFQDGANRKDAKKVANLIHENASVMIGRDRRILSKAEYIKILPKRLAENPSISLGKPRMKVSGETAEVKIYMTRGDYNGLIIYDMKLDNNNWYIHSWRY
ncbi:MAG: nuclear transport factor 2 family protein [bacterium]|nr:nuclear transport factor 2 family protein [bacterium]